MIVPPRTIDPATDGGTIRVRGARVHNLQGIDVDVPRDRLVVLTGVSGSGKSSLAFDTLFAEGRRRYIEGLSSYARQFLDQLEPPDVDQVEGLPPTVAIDQRAGLAGPRSTVATVTEIHDYLRLLYARTGLPHCPNCGQPIRRQSPEQMASTILGLPEGSKVLLLAPLVRGRKGQHAEAFDAIRRAGLLRARVDGRVVEVQEAPKLAKTKAHTIEAVVDRLVIRDGIRPRLAESLDRALKLADGTAIVTILNDEGPEDRVLSTQFACPDCGVGLAEIEPRTFSFNSPYGACRACDGLGSRRAFDPDLVIPDRSRSLLKGAVVPWRTSGTGEAGAIYRTSWIARFLKQHKIGREAPLSSWPPDVLRQFVEGESDPPVPGVLAMLDEAHAAARSDRTRAALDAFRVDLACPSCGGSRLRAEARAVTVGGRSIQEVSDLTATEARTYFESLAFEPPMDQVGPPIVHEIRGRLGFLDRVGLGYLTLARGSDTLSGGELQRVRLAAQIGSGLVGVAYVLDEPTTGLHPRDTDRLLASLRDLRDQGNSVLVVEHDDLMIRSADWVIDLGPGAGPDGGRIVAQGPPDQLDGPESITARYLRRETTIEAPVSDRLTRSPGRIAIVGASEHNLKEIDVQVPVGCLTVVSGVSGSGKSTLVQDVLSRAVRRRLDGSGPRPGTFERIEGFEFIDKLIAIDQAPIGRTPRSTPATYTGVFDAIRAVFARTRAAKVRGYKASRFSFNVRGGRCETCQGQGFRRIEMQFLPDLFVRCEACGGQRFNRQTLEARYKGKSIGEVLEMRVDEAVSFFEAIPKVRAGLVALHDAGLGYVTLGQSSTTLSGGEAQRVKLASELGRASTGRTLYILDEPTTGLHAADVAALLRVLHRLADAGNTLVIIEHNLDVIKAADWLIDLGPEGGSDGGSVVAMGTLAEVARVEASHTGCFLKLNPGNPDLFS